MLRNIIALVVVASLSGCAQTVAHTPLTQAEFASLELTQIAPERYWGDQPPENFDDAIAGRAELLRELLVSQSGEEGPYRDHALVLSGGSANGAFGAGLLAGWTASGSRPEFNYVTGVSTGAMLAPFAFLGSAYDEKMVEAYTSITRKDIYKSQAAGGLLFGSALGDTRPLRELVAGYVTPQMVDEIAKEHRRGRALVVVTTHLGALRPVVWNIGEIANNRGAQGVQLIRDIIVASASIPGFFPPIPLSWEVDGREFTELHVDGAVTGQVFAYPAGIDIQKLNNAIGLPVERVVYVIRNSNASMEYEEAPVKTLPIMMRALDGILQTQLTSQIENIYWQSKRDGIRFNSIAIPDSFVADRSSEFDAQYMSDLAELGRSIGETSDFWFSKPSSLRQ